MLAARSTLQRARRAAAPEATIMLCATCATALDAPPTPDAACPRCLGPTLLAARYQLVRSLGAGAFGMTYEAVRVADGQHVAIKELSYRNIDAVKSHELFEREAAILKRLEHPNIPRCHEDFVWGVGKNQALYLVEDLIEGQTLAEELRTRAYDEAAVVEIIAALLEILTYLHSRTPPVIHRDIKPDNVMRAADGRLVLVDFGAVRSGVAQTGGSTMVGTFGYMAPELFRGEACEASDLYAVGALACALLTGREPHTLMDGAHVLRLPDRVAVSAVLRALLGRLLAAEVEGRPASASEALALLRRGGAPAALVRAAPVALARREGEESLFGLSAALALVPLFLSPCLVMTIGLLPTLSVMGGVALLAILCVPFMKGDEG